MRDLLDRLGVLIKRKATAPKAKKTRKTATKKTAARKTAHKKTPAPRSGTVHHPRKAASPKPATVAA